MYKYDLQIELSTQTTLSVAKSNISGKAFYQIMFATYRYVFTKWVGADLSAQYV